MQKKVIKIEMALEDDILKVKKGFETSAKQARLMLAAAANNTNETLSFLNNALKISENYLAKAKELGSPELIKRGQDIKTEFEGSISKWNKVYASIKAINLN
jgi:hypothetical protein